MRLYLNCYIYVDTNAHLFSRATIRNFANITVTNCVTASSCNANQIRQQLCMVLEYCDFQLCCFVGQRKIIFVNWSKQLEHISADVTDYFGCCRKMVDGGIIDGNHLIQTFLCAMSRSPIFIRLGDRHLGTPERAAN